MLRRLLRPLTKVMPGRHHGSVRVLVPDEKAKDRGFHDVTLIDMANADGPYVPVSNLSLLHRQWPVSVVNGMAQKQLELEQLRHACKKRYCGAHTGCCSFCRKVIKRDMARHVANYHPELAQLWRCTVSWCTQWKGTPQDCVDHIRSPHAMLTSVTAANLGKWFPPWTVFLEMWCEVLKSHVS